MAPIDIIILSRYYFTSFNFLSYSELYFWIMRYGKKLFVFNETRNKVVCVFEDKLSEARYCFMAIKTGINKTFTVMRGTWKLQISSVRFREVIVIKCRYMEHNNRIYYCLAT